ncbi:Clp protease N-terminal domain-containing protein [Streptomyces sp. NPDC023723]|uniref:Clp protease N-terminal domain-containing protein n=1 Tax=Streptomyces sp. NPDC023723 TaxID=3154323 RepID=UPI0033E9350A
MTRPTPPVGLDDLITAITGRRTDALDQLTEAVATADRVGAAADRLIGHFVDRARRSGVSWTDIGRRTGVTEQAARTRFGGEPAAARPAFDKLTRPAHNAVVAAMKEAKQGGSAEIEPAHLVLGLLGADGTAVAALRTQGVDLGRLRDAAVAALPARGDARPAMVPYGARAKTALELTFQAAALLDDDGVGTGHVLLGLLAEENGTGLLHSLGAGLETTERFVTDAGKEPPVSR